MVDAINRRESGHIITLEDPIEYCLHQQQELHRAARGGARTCPNFASGPASSLRQDPDVILVGEMRDLETTGSAITAAETGHLVFSTAAHRQRPQTIERISISTPSDQQKPDPLDVVQHSAGGHLSDALSGGWISRAWCPAVEVVMLCTLRGAQLHPRDRVFEIPTGGRDQPRESGCRRWTARSSSFVNGYISKEDAIAQAAHPEKLERSIAA